MDKSMNKTLYLSINFNDKEKNIISIKISFEKLNFTDILLEFPHTISINNIELLIKSKKFINFIKNFDVEKGFLEKLYILDIFMFRNNLGFANIEICYSLFQKLGNKESQDKDDISYCNYKNNINSDNKLIFKNSSIESINNKSNEKFKFCQISKDFKNFKTIAKENLNNDPSNFNLGNNIDLEGFNIKSSFCDKKIKKLNGCLFLRGGSVAILTIINSKYLLLTRQFRVPEGIMKLGIPAGMLDESGDFCGVAAQELKEETGININFKDLIYLTSTYLTPEYSDEEISLFATHVILKEEDIKNLFFREYGHGEHEIITLIICDFTKKEIFNLNNIAIYCAAFSYERVMNRIIPE